MTALLGKIPIEKIRRVYLIILLVCLCVRNIGVYTLGPSVVDIFVFSVLGGLGFFLFILEVMSGKIEFRSVTNIFLMLFVLVLAIGSIINLKYGIFQNIKECIWTIISFFVIRGYADGDEMHNRAKDVIRVQNIIIIFWFVLSFLSICTAILQIGNIMIVKDNICVGIGISENRLFGVFINPNTASIVSVIAMLFSIFQIAYSTQGVLNLKFNVANIVIQLMYISLSESRGSGMVLLFVSFVLAFVYSSGLFKTSGVKKFLISFLVAVMFTVAIYFTMQLITKVFSAIPPFSSDIEVLSRYDCHARIGKRSDYVNNNDISNLRFKIWRSAWEIFKKNWFFGVTPGNILSYAQVMMPDTFMAVRGYKRAHSVWFGIPLYTGICGAFCMFGFFIKKAIDFLNNYRKMRFNERTIPIFNLCVMIVVCIWLYGTVESEILFVNSVCSFVFWYFMGISERCTNFSGKGIES